jgi:hypothetical protein
MLVVFVIAIGWAISRNLDISCGCFNTGATDAGKMTHWTLYWDIIWLAMGLVALVFDRRVLAISHLWRRRSGP